MSFNIGEMKHPKAGSIRLEISNDDEFVRRVKKINKDLPGSNKDNMKLWKISRVGEDRVPAKIRKLIEGSEEDQKESAQTFKEFIAEQKAKKEAASA